MVGRDKTQRKSIDGRNGWVGWSISTRDRRVYIENNGGREERKTPPQKHWLFSGAIAALWVLSI